MKYEQVTLWDTDDNPCDDCIFDKNGCCDHEETPEAYCVEGSFRIRHSEVICPECGRTVKVIQQPYGSDWGDCKCGKGIIFHNRGNRIGWYQAYREGKVK